MQAIIEDFLAQADITVNGNKPYDIQINNPEELYSALSRNISIGAGESFMNNDWDCQAIDELFFRLSRVCSIDKIRGKKTILWFAIKNNITNLQSITRSTQVANIHYNLDNDLYKRMLGKSMAYTCAYWKDAQTLDDAQNAKYKLVCEKLSLNSQDRLLDLGCGWGGFSKYAATNYGCEVVAVNIASEQIKLAKQECQNLPISFYAEDYRNTKIYNPKQQPFTKIATIGLCEHIGTKNYSNFIDIMKSQVCEDGLILLHTIGKASDEQVADPWINKYIFPNGMIPALSQLTHAIENKLVIEDIHNFGAYYDKTLMAWHQNFIDSWPEIKDRFNDKFFRMWKYYLLTCAGVFRARDLQLWQIVMSPKGIINGYTSIR